MKMSVTENNDYLNYYELPDGFYELVRFLDLDTPQSLEYARKMCKGEVFALAQHWVNGVIIENEKGYLKKSLFGHFLLETGIKKTASLKIDFSFLIDNARTLFVTPWQEGITWHLEDHGEYESFKYLDNEVVPLSFLIYQKVSHQWYFSIPEEVRTRLASYSTNEFAILYLTSHYEYAYQLFISHPTLFWMLICKARENKQTESELLQWLARSRRDILRYCGLPATKSAIKVISKLKFERFNTTSLNIISSIFMIDDYARLNHCKQIDENIINLIKAHPQLIKSCLLHRLCNSEINAERVLSDINDIETMAQELTIQNIQSRIEQCQSVKDITSLHDKLVKRLNAVSLSDRFEVEYPSPPIPGNNDIKPITTGKALFYEGVSQHHCIATYHDRIMQGNYYAYRINNPQRATLGLSLDKDGKPRIDQCVIAHNEPVSQITENSVKQWLNSQIK